jgi:hypothetical protein
VAFGLSSVEVFSVVVFTDIISVLGSFLQEKTSANKNTAVKVFLKKFMLF